MARHNDLVREGEEKAACYLRQHGYLILEKNWRLGHLELDLICKKENLLVVVEVKTRFSEEDRPEELLNYTKRRCLRQAADAYIKANKLQTEVRFDLILVTGATWEIEHVVEAIQVFE